MYLLYDLVLLVAGIALIPYYLMRGLRGGKSRRGIRERLGFYHGKTLGLLRDRDLIWIHAVSVGETRAAIPLIKALRSAYPAAALILSNVTETGHAVAGGIRELDASIFFPFDLSWAVRRAFEKLNPRLIVIVETEIWPNFIRFAGKQGIPVFLVNGRISDRSFPRYMRCRFLMQAILRSFSAFCMQSQTDAERIRQIGASESRIEVTGNLKFDMRAAFSESLTAVELKKELRLPEGGEVWVAGSTHAGEEEIVAGVYRRLLSSFPTLSLVLVPRHPERTRAIGEMLESQGLRFVLRSKVCSLRRTLEPGEILLGDTLGEMLGFYSCSDLVFLGGSLVNVGGHNMLEASLLKKPVIFGPHVQNFKEISRMLLEVGGGFSVSGEEQLFETVRCLLKDPEMRRSAGEKGFSLLERNCGATEHTLSVIRKHLESPATPASDRKDFYARA